MDADSARDGPAAITEERMPSQMLEVAVVEAAEIRIDDRGLYRVVITDGSRTVYESPHGYDDLQELLAAHAGFHAELEEAARRLLEEGKVKQTGPTAG